MAFFGAAVGLEKLTVVKFIGILFAVAGALGTYTMVRRARSRGR